jgi:hypothetical protein
MDLCLNQVWRQEFVIFCPHAGGKSSFGPSTHQPIHVSPYNPLKYLIFADITYARYARHQHKTTLQTPLKSAKYAHKSHSFAESKLSVPASTAAFSDKLPITQ